MIGLTTGQQQCANLPQLLMTAAQDRAREHLKNDKDGIGKRKYSMWEQQKGKQQRYDFYDSEFFRDCYTLSKLPWSFGISCKAIAAVCSDNIRCQQILHSCASGVCVGCGPGSDAIALLGQRDSHQPLTLFLIDKCSGWQMYITELDECLRRLGHPLSLWFKVAKVNDAADADRTLPQADMVMLSFAHSVNANPDLWRHLANRYSLVLIVDIESESLATSLEEADYKSCHIESQSSVSVFYHLRQ